MSTRTKNKTPGKIRWILLAISGCLLGLGAGAVLIRGYWSPQVQAQTEGPQKTPVPSPTPAATTDSSVPPPSTEYTQRAVGYIFDNVPITREMLGEYLIARCGAEKLELLANKMIIEEAAKTRGVTVTTAEVEASLADDVSSLAISRREFIDKVLKSYKKTEYEWREDVIRPRLLMTKMCGNRVKVTEEELHKGFIAYHGEKVDGRLILWPPNEERAARSEYARLRDSEEAFATKAKAQASPELASKGGKLPGPVGHYTTGNDSLEREMFALQPGEVTPLIQVPEGWVIFKCDSRTPADTTVNFDADRPRLMAEITKKKTAMEIQNFFKELKEAAHYRPMLAGAPKPNDLKREVQQELKDYPHILDEKNPKVPSGAETPGQK